jgi:hypothetical protein
VLAIACALASVCPPQQAPERPFASVAPPAAPASAPAPLPGARPGTQRWLVHFAKRSFDLEGLRAATLARKPAAEIAGLVADLDRRARADQEPFVRAVERLDGVVLAQWWLVNGCAVEIHAAAVDAVRALPDVLRLEPDMSAEPSIKTATNALNHGADAVHALGFKGEGVTVALLDGGFDADMSGTGRPHRVFYPDGDPNNRTGGGIAGSRLLFTTQLGALLPEAVPWHGTFVSACAAGGNWGTASADHGHAYGAKIAGYAVANAANGNTNSTVLTTGWQTIVADRARGVNIVAANNSYQGPAQSDPLSFVQQALDAAAYASDILITVVAGNAAGGTNAAVGHSAANGIVAAAVRLDSHRMADFSNRGPAAHDAQRFWPDLAATGVDIVGPLPDCEGSNGSGAGTSFAAPQICGAAAVLRAAHPTLRADETKAVLLASALDITARNPDPPYNTRNAYGMGLLRDDVALATVRAGRHGWARLTTTNPQWAFPITVAGGTDYGLAVTWHRKVMTSTAWSNLDVRVLDGSNAIATSATPRNLYEMVRFRASQNATYTVEVTATTLEGNDQEFAFAFAESRQPTPAASYETFAAGCNGSGGNGVAGPVCFGANVNEIAIATGRMAEHFEFVVREQTTAPVNIAGYSLLTYSLVANPVPMTILVYLTDAQGVPIGQPIATTTMTVGTQLAWYGALFAAPVAIPGSTMFCIGFRTGDTAPMQPVPLTGLEGRPFFRRDACAQTWEYITFVAACHRVHCTGTGSASIPPLLANDGLPSPGRTFTLQLAHARANAQALLFTGLSRTQWGSLQLPYNFAAFGAPTCALRVSGEAIVAVALDAAGRAALALPVPNIADLLGQRFLQQFFATDNVNPLGLVASNAVIALVGLVP